VGVKWLRRWAKGLVGIPSADVKRNNLDGKQSVAPALAA